MLVTLATNGSIMDRLRCKHSFHRDGTIAFKPHFLVGLSTYVPWHEKISYVRSYLLSAIVALISWTASRLRQAELRKIVPWLEQQDANPQWPAHVRVTIANLARRLGYALP